MVNLVAAAVDQLRVCKQFPYQIDIRPDVRIPLSDGCFLHARLWIPRNADVIPLPAVIEYAPFRHRDFTAARDALIHPWFAGHGYASLRIELRGSGDSTGLPQDEYVLQEQNDAVEALEWIAAQDWCNGNTGMFGMSWGAFSALQVNEHHPPSLKAIIPVHGTDDRFTDDIHYKGGCLLTAGLSWGTLYSLYMMRPPDPELSGTDWRDRWLERFDQCEFVLPRWMSHQYKNDYWRHGSVAEDYSKLACPALVICGWADGYTNAAFRMAEHLPQSSRILIGPWAHTYPHLAQPAPQIGFLQEATRWWDRWLKNVDNGVEQLPRVRLWMQESVPPLSSYKQRDGEWLGFDRWPPPAVDQRRFYLQSGRLHSSQPGKTVETICSPLANAINGPEWLPHGVGQEMPVEQSEEDLGSICFDTDLLESALPICGATSLKLRCCANTESGILLVRLIDRREDGQSTQISYGLLNLIHRNGLDQPEPLTPGEWFDVEIRLNDIAQIVPAGHRLRIAVSTCCWPLAWPAAKTMTLQLSLADCSMHLPALDANNIKQYKTPPPDAAAIPEALPITWLRPVDRQRRVKINSSEHTVSRVYIKDDGAFRIEEHGLEVDALGSLAYHCCGEDPLSAKAEYRYRIGHARKNWQAGVECEVEVSADAENFYVRGEYRAIEDRRVIKRRMIDVMVKRQFV